MTDLDSIIGGGPAGMTAVTYLRRLHRRVVVFDDGRSRARWIPESHNCPGFPLGVSGDQASANAPCHRALTGGQKGVETLSTGGTE